MKVIAIITVISLTVEAQLVFQHESSNTKLKWGSSGKSQNAKGKERKLPGLGNCLASGMKNLTVCIETVQSHSKGKGPAGPQPKNECEIRRRSLIDWWNSFKDLSEDEEINIVIEGDTTRGGKQTKFKKITRRPGGTTASPTDKKEFKEIMTCIKNAANYFIICLCEQAEKQLSLRTAMQRQQAAEVQKTQVKQVKRGNPKPKIEALEMDIEVETLRRNSNPTYSNATYSNVTTGV